MKKAECLSEAAIHKGAGSGRSPNVHEAVVAWIAANTSC